MTTVCLVGDEDVNLQYELLSRETARDALAAYDLREPFHNSIAVETVSLGAAVSLLNDLDWYLVRFVEQGLVFDPSVADSEWLSRGLAEAIRDEAIDAADSGRYLKVYGLELPDETGQTDDDGSGGNTAGAKSEARSGSEGESPATGETDDAGGADEAGEEAAGEGGDAVGSAGRTAASVPGITDRGRRGAGTDGPPPRLVEPMFVTRTGDTIPEYDLRPVADTLLVRVTESEFGA